MQIHLTGNILYMDNDELDSLDHDGEACLYFEDNLELNLKRKAQVRVRFISYGRPLLESIYFEKLKKKSSNGIRLFISKERPIGYGIPEKLYIFSKKEKWKRV